MKMKIYRYSLIALSAAVMLVWSQSCTREFDELELAKFPSTPEVFMDGFSSGLNYAAFGGSKVTAFDVDNETKYSGSSSMKIEIPDAGDPEGSYAGGVYFTSVARDLSSYDALTFYAKASKAASVDLVGFGNDLGESKFLVSLKGMKVNSNWKKYIIPIPDPSILTEEKGMFYYSEGPEDGTGYTLWIDEVKFEKLGTIAHKRPVILGGTDVTESAVNGLSLQLSGLEVIFNMPTGIDQSFEVAPAWFSFASSNENVAAVNELGKVNVLAQGSAKITATSGGTDATGSMTVVSSGDFIHAPDPSYASEDVISIFSNAFANVPVDFYNGYWQPYQTTLSSDFTVNDDDVLYYTNFNFVGIQFTSPTIDASEMTHLHMDVWIPNAVASGDKLSVKVVDMGPDGALDGTDPSISYEIPGPLASQNWISVDMSLASLTSKGKLAQIILENLGTGLSGFYLDNVILYKGGGGPATGPADAAPTPPARDAADVISLYGDAYTNLDGSDYPNWGQATVVSEVQVAGNNTLKFAGLNYQGLQLANAQDVTGMEYLHLDFWTANSTALNVYLISPGPVEKAYALSVPTTGWGSVDIPLTGFSPVDLTDVIQLKWDGNGDIYLDNLYFYTEGGSPVNQPAVPAPVPPARDAADVISLFSNVYTNNTVGTWSADWDDSDVADFQVAGDDIKKYTFTNFAGIDFSSNKINASEMTHFHIDIWTPDEVLSKSLTIKNVDFGGGSAEATNHILTVVHTASGDVPALQTGSWVSVDVPLTAFAGSLTRSDLAQIVLATNLQTVYLDNLYFYKSGGGTTEPTAAAPAPPARDAADVVSVFSEAYTNITGTDFNPNWGQTTVVTTESIAGNSTLKYANFNYQGTAFAAGQDLSGMQYLHIDMWTADATVVKVSPINGSGSPAENLVSLTPITAGQWVSYDIPLTDFTSSGMSLNNVIQMKFDGQAGTNPSTIYLDNIYFYKTGGGSGDDPATPAPIPPARNAADVASFFSNAYTNVTVDTWSAVWDDSDVTDLQISGNDVKKYTFTNFAGIDFSNHKLDLSAMTGFHLDIYVPEDVIPGDVLTIKCVDFGGGAAEATNFILTVVHTVNGSIPALEKGKWISIDLPVTAFAGTLTRSDLAQIVLTCTLDNLYIDNLYFYK